MNDIVSLDEVRARRDARQQSHRSLAANLAGLLPLPSTPACAAGDCGSCPGEHNGILCGHDCGHGFKAVS